MAVTGLQPGCPCCGGGGGSVPSPYCCTCAWPVSPTLRTPLGTITLTATTQLIGGQCASRTWSGQLAIQAVGIPINFFPPAPPFPGTIFLGDGWLKCCREHTLVSGTVTWRVTIDCRQLTQPTPGEYWICESLWAACSPCIPLSGPGPCPGDTLGIPVHDTPTLPPGSYENFGACGFGSPVRSAAFASRFIDLEPASSGCPPRCITFQTTMPGVGLVNVEFCP